MEHVLKRTERSWIARIVTTSVPELVETETDYLLTVGGSQPAFLVLTTPNAVGADDPGRVMHLIGVARRQHRLVFQIGRAIVLAFNGAWGHPAIVDSLATLLVRHQIGGPVPTLLPRSRFRSGLRALRAWLRELAASKDENAQQGTVPAPAQAPALAAPLATAQEASVSSGRASEAAAWVAPEQDADTA